MDIIIPKYISTRTYTLTNGISFTYICNTKNNTYYILKGKISELWNNIVLNQNYNKALLFANKNNILDNLDDFLYELIQENLILYNLEPKKLYKNYLTLKINEKSNNYKYFKDLFSYVQESNGFLGTLYIEVTHKCNLKCKHCCNNKKNNNSEINFETAKKLIDDAYNNLGIYKVVLTGGECTTNKDFFKIVQYIKEKHLDIKILTNATTLYDNKELLNKIISLYPSEVQISLYSMNSTIHDNMTGVEGSHNKTLSVINELREKFINVCITCFQSSYNIDSYQDVSKFAKSIGAEMLQNCQFIYNKNNRNLEAKLNYKNTKNFYIQTLNKGQIRNFRKDDTLICKAGTERISITPNLDIIPCPYFEHILGNYNNINFIELKNKILPEFRNLFIRNNLKECFKHDYCNYCFYCATIANFDTGFLKKSKLLCEDAKAYYEASLNYDDLTK